MAIRSAVPRDFVWNVHTRFTELDTIVPVAINNTGDVAGTCLNSGLACALIGREICAPTHARATVALVHTGSTIEAMCS